jgi:hypothetical protein
LHAPPRKLGRSLDGRVVSRGMMTRMSSISSAFLAHGSRASLLPDCLGCRYGMARTPWRNTSRIAYPRAFFTSRLTVFFLKNQPFNPPSTGRCGDLPQRFLPIENPLLRCELALAGANHVFTPEVLPEEAEDGILTAEDVACLDLQGTEIVVLSACETGLGEVQIGEGGIRVAEGLRLGWGEDSHHESLEGRRPTDGDPHGTSVRESDRGAHAS